MATSRGTTSRGRKRQAEQEAAERSVGPAMVDGVSKMRQTPDSRAGVTAVLYMGQHFPSWAALYAEHPEAREHAKGKRGTTGPGKDREALWPEMATAPTRAASAAGAGEDDDDERGAEDGQGGGEATATGGAAAEGDGYTAEDLKDVSTEDLAEIAEAKGLKVKGARGRKPSRKHYLDALIGK